MMSANGKLARDILLSYNPLSKGGYCWHYVWKAYAEAGASTSMSALPTAYAAWQASEGKHYDMAPPEGAAIWLGKRFSDGNMDGDVFIAGAYDGKHAATDFPSWFEVGECSLQQRINQTGREYLGWTDHVLDCPINIYSNNFTKSIKENEVFIAVVNNAQWWLCVPQGNGKPRAVILGPAGDPQSQGVPIFYFSGDQVDSLKRAVDGI